jgi:hypothetical protein
MAKGFRDCFEILGVTPDDSKERIAEAYRRKARIVHPDSAGGNHDRFVELQDAYETLADDRKRSAFLRERGLEIARRSLVEYGPLVRDLYDDMIEYAKDVIGARRCDVFCIISDRKYRSQDKIFVLNVKVENTCESCKGVGSLLGRDCRECGGTGVIHVSIEHELNVPAGAEDGTFIECDLPDRRLVYRISYR